jgi:hypothetical protein
LSSVLPFWDKTWDKTSFVPLPKMAEFLAFLDAPKEPGDGFELSVPLAKARNSGPGIRVIRGGVPGCVSPALSQ